MLPKKELPLIWDQLPCGILLAAYDGIIQNANATLLQWLGYKQSELVGKRKWTDLVSLGGRIFYQTQHAPLLVLQGIANELNYDMIHKDGQRIPVLVNSSLLPAEKGEEPLICFSIFTFSDRKKYEQELLLARKKAEAAAEAKSLFISTVTHEIRTPLNAILSVSDFLFREPHNNEQRELLLVLSNAAKNLLELVNDILDLHKIEAGAQHLDLRPFHVPHLLKNIVETLYPKALQKGIALQMSLPPDPVPAVLGDPIKLGQVITNLVSNAVKFTEKGQVDVIFRHEPDLLNKIKLHFEVKDTGIGIRPEHLEKIFDPFSQADNDISIRFGGTGLGLAISENILAVYNSRLRVESEFGKGSTFSFTLSLPTDPNQQPLPLIAPPVTLSLAPLGNFKVLLVDDNPTNLMLGARYLKQWGLEVEQAHNGQEAFEKTQHETFDLVLMDLRMPVLNGYDAARRIRELNAGGGRRLPIIALSATTSNALTAEMVDAGIDDLVMKPVHPPQLHEVLRKYLEQSEIVDIGFQESSQTQAPNFSDLVGQEGSPVAQPSAALDNKDDRCGLVAQTPSMQKIWEVFEDDREGILVYLHAVAEDMEIIIRKFVAVSNEGSLEAYRDAVHYAQTVVEMLSMHYLKPHFLLGRNLLEQGQLNEYSEVSEMIVTLLQDALAWLKNKREEFDREK